MKAVIHRPDGTRIEIDGTVDEVERVLNGTREPEPVSIPSPLGPPMQWPYTMPQMQPWEWRYGTWCNTGTEAEL